LYLRDALSNGMNQAVQGSLAKQFPSLTAHITTVSTSDTFASDVEEEANSYFQVRNSQLVHWLEVGVLVGEQSQKANLFLDDVHVLWPD
jgi:hypothetical protein